MCNVQPSWKDVSNIFYIISCSRCARKAWWRHLYALWRRSWPRSVLVDSHDGLHGPRLSDHGRPLGDNPHVKNQQCSQSWSRNLHFGWVGGFFDQVGPPFISSCSPGGSSRCTRKRTLFYGHHFRQPRRKRVVKSKDSIRQSIVVYLYPLSMYLL